MMPAEQDATIAPLEVLFDASAGDALPLPPALSELYGRLAFPMDAEDRRVIANFVETLDGVVSLGIPGKAGGGPISGRSPHDRFVMALIRSVADAVVVGAATLRASHNHVWTPEHVYPRLAPEFQRVRAALGKAPHPLNVIVTGRGDVSPGARVFQQRDAPVLIITTATGARAIDRTSLAPNVDVVVSTHDDRLSPDDILAAIGDAIDWRLCVSEAGPSLMGQFLAARKIDELFLTLAPQIAGRDDGSARPGLVSGRLFAPDDAVWGALVSARRAGSHLFLRYALTPVVGTEL